MRSAYALAASPLLLAAPPAASQQLPPIRPLGPVTHVSPQGLLGSVSMARPLSTGGAIIHDITRRQLILFDSALSTAKTIADTSPTIAPPSAWALTDPTSRATSGCARPSPRTVAPSTT